MRRWGRYLLQEILPLYFAGLAMLLLLLLGGFMLELLADALSRGVPIGLMARYLLYKLPVAATYGIPLTLGLLVIAVRFFNNEVVVPRSERLALEVQKDILLRSPESLVQEGSFFTDALGRSIFIERLEPGGAFSGVTVITPGGARGPSEVIRAESGQLDEESGVWNLQGLAMRVYRNSRLVLDFKAETGVLPVQGLSAASSTPSDLALLPTGELLQRIRNAPQDREQPAEYTALHRKLAEPLAATAFAIFALAVALFSFRRGVPLGLVSVMFLTFVYYATWSVFKLLGAQGTIPPWLGGWGPLLLYLGAGLLLLVWSWRR